MTSSIVFPGSVCDLSEDPPAISSGYETNIHFTLGNPVNFNPHTHSPGHYSSSASWKPLSPIPPSSRNGYPDFGSNSTVYPSPPPTSSRPGQSVPLPDVCCGTPGLVAVKQSLESFGHSFRPVSPPRIGDEALKVREPFSPPPTLPIQTLSLPPMQHDLMPYQEMQTDHIIDLQSTSSALVHAHHRKIRYLSSPPPSPEGIFMKAAEILLPLSPDAGLFFSDSLHSSSLFVDHEVPEMFDPFDYDSHLGGRSAQRLWHPAVDAIMNDDSSKSSDTIPTSSQPWYSPGEEVDLDMTFWGHIPQATSLPPLHILRPQDFHDTPRLLSPPYPQPSSPLLSSPASSDQDFDCHDYDDGSMTPFSPPSSPSLRSFSELPMIEDEEDLIDGDKPLFRNSSPASQVSFQSQDCEGRAPPIRSFPGVEVDVDLIPVDLASRSSAPEHCIVIPSSPYITPSTFPTPSYLVGHNGKSQSNSSTKYGGNSLLLHDEIQSDLVAGSSGLGIDLDQLNPSIVAKYPELRWLLDLRTRVLASERQARMVETQYENVKAFWQRDVRKSTELVDDESEAQFQPQHEEARMQLLLAMQAKKARKRERERLKEINALIKIKLEEKGVLLGHTKNEGMDLCSPCCADGYMQDLDAETTGVNVALHKCGHNARSNKDITATMPQLVARMILRRRESRLRPLTRPRHVRGDLGSTSVDDLCPHGRAPGRRRSSPLVLTAPSVHDQDGTANDQRPISHPNPLQFDRERCQLHYSPLDWHMDVDCHACSDSAINTLDDLDLNSPFDLLSLSDT